MIIHHLALPDDWAAARESGEYRISTRGATLDEVGFIHGATAEQVAGVRERYYADLDELVLLTIETDLLTSPWQLDEVGDQWFLHVYGPINLDAVVETGVTRSSHDTEA